ncbi:hypothetical protein [Photobacterium phosphoreum]|uniref:hypothetical protein n=1 Tax=Photobacterium phosphoreum TaxID=659 RepID=UPI0007F93956|nr:hypothetical protein [Photobacterium phosphoreum]OBU38344.1 hypothetical protein AYY25_04570 [Photobacterium phosphoreum]
MIKRKVISVLVIATMALMAEGCDSGSKPHSSAPFSTTAQVETQSIQARNLTQQVMGYGVIKSHNVVTLKNLQTNKITAIFFY